MDKFDKVIFGAISVLIALLMLISFTEAKSTQLLLRELGIKASFWESAGVDKQFVKGRLMERKQGEGNE